MKFNYRFSAAVFGVALALGGCAKLVETAQFVSTANAAVQDLTVSPEAVLIASNAFDAVQVTATNYLRLKRCTGENGPLCRDPDYTKTLIASIKTGRQARDDLQQFLRDNPGKLGKAGLYNALVQSIDSIRGMIATYTAASAATTGAKP